MAHKKLDVLEGRTDSGEFMGNTRYVGRNAEIVGCPCPQSKFGARRAKDIRILYGSLFLRLVLIR